MDRLEAAKRAVDAEADDAHEQLDRLFIAAKLIEEQMDSVAVNDAVGRARNLQQRALAVCRSLVVYPPRMQQLVDYLPTQVDIMNEAVENRSTYAALRMDEVEIVLTQIERALFGSSPPVANAVGVQPIPAVPSLLSSSVSVPLSSSLPAAAPGSAPAAPISVHYVGTPAFTSNVLLVPAAAVPPPATPSASVSVSHNNADVNAIRDVSDIPRATRSARLSRQRQLQRAHALSPLAGPAHVIYRTLLESPSEPRDVAVSLKQMSDFHWNLIKAIHACQSGSSVSSGGRCDM